MLGELHIAVPKNKAGAESVDVTYTYDINSILEVEVFVPSTGVKKKQIIKGKDNEMTDQQIAERMEELAYLKIQPRDKEENKLLLLRGERLYEESTGDVRRQIEFYMRQFEEALNSHNEGKILDAREGLRDILKEAEEELF